MDPDVIMTLGSSSVLSDQNGLCDCIVLEHQHSYRLLPRMGHPCGFWWHHGSCMSAQTRAAVWPWTQTYPLTEAQAWCHSWPWWERRSATLAHFLLSLPPITAHKLLLPLDLSHISTTHVAIIIVPILTVPQGPVQVVESFIQPRLWGPRLAHEYLSLAWAKWLHQACGCLQTVYSVTFL